MVRGICMQLDYPVSYFATSSLSAVIGAVESMGLKVIAVTADGASQNRKFFNMHQDPSESNVSNGITYKTINMYALEREVYFLSDVLHLVKTIKNCWEKSCFGGTRLMQVWLTRV